MESALALDLNITSLDVGEHRVGVRYRDDLNQWSEVRWTDLVIYEDTENTTPAPAASGYTGISGITGGEYFIGADPGAGSGTSFQRSDGSFDSDMESALALDLNITSLDVGEHRVGVRYRDDLNQWSEVRWTDLVIYEDTENTTRHRQLLDTREYLGSLAENIL